MNTQPNIILITAIELKAIAPVSDKSIEVFLPHINVGLKKYNIDTPLRIAAFIAQVLHESLCFKYVREIWGPTAQQKKYERNDKEKWPPAIPTDINWLAWNLGNRQPGDGAKFKGHGLIQITGRTNHEICSKDMFGDTRLLESPELLTAPEYAALSACWFWDRREINKAADEGDFKRVTKLVNGGLNGYEERLKYYESALEVLK